MKVIGLTGSFGTGKTFVASIFRSLGARVLDADRMAHAAIRKGSPAYGRIVKSFGKGILNQKGEIDRKRLGQKAFSDKKSLRKLNAIIHPEVIRAIKSYLGNARRDEIVVIDAPLLIEAGLDRLVDILVVVRCSKRRQIERCQEKFCLQRAEILRRIASQLPIGRKAKMADIVIENSGSRSRTRREVIKAWRGKLWR